MEFLRHLEADLLAPVTENNNSRYRPYWIITWVMITTALRVSNVSKLILADNKLFIDNSYDKYAQHTNKL